MIRRKLVMVGDGGCGKVGHLVWAQYQSIVDNDVLESYTDILGAFLVHWCGTTGMRIVHTSNRNILIQLY